MTSLTFSVARQYVEHGVTCNGIAPCYVFGPMIIDALSEERRAELLETIPVRKFCTPEEVAHTVDYLVHPLAGFVTVRSTPCKPAFVVRLFLVLPTMHLSARARAVLVRDACHAVRLRQGEIIDQNGGFQMD